MDEGLAELQRRLQHVFSDRALLVRALTHRSFAADHNERLEFLGDAVLDLAVSDMLFQRLGDLPEGDLSRVRANLVKQDTLHELALELQLAASVRLGAGMVLSASKKRTSVLADTLEALIGAVYLDGGFASANALVQRLFGKLEINPGMAAIGKDAKTELQEWLQGRRMKLPVYRVVGTLGAAHQQSFDVECEVAERNLSERGIGDSRRAGEQAAATAMLQTLRNAANDQ